MAKEVVNYNLKIPLVGFFRRVEVQDCYPPGAYKNDKIHCTFQVQVSAI